MSVHRFNAKCEICSKNYTIRHSVTYTNPQLSKFSCLDCGETISYEFSWRPNPFGIRILPIQNFVGCIEEGQIINVNMATGVHEADISNPHYFPMMGLLNDGLNTEAEIPHEAAIRIIQAKANAWAELRKPIALFSKGKAKQLSVFFRSNGVSTESKSLAPIVSDIVRSFAESIVTCKSVLDEFIKIKTFTDEIQKDHPDQFEEMKKYLANNSQERARQHLEILDDYTRVIDVFSSIRSRNTLNLSTENLAFDDASFSTIRTYYGNLFEHLSSSIAVFALLNNISEHNPHFELTPTT